jgi:hypothetical protein
LYCCRSSPHLLAGVVVIAQLPADLLNAHIRDKCSPQKVLGRAGSALGAPNLLCRRVGRANPVLGPHSQENGRGKEHQQPEVENEAKKLHGTLSYYRSNVCRAIAGHLTSTEKVVVVFFR